MLQSYKQYFRIEYLLLFLFAFEFLDKTNYIIIALLLYLALKYKIQNSISNTYLMCVLLFATFYFILGGNTISFTDPFAWVFSYLIGLILCKNDKVSYIYLFVIIALGTTLNGILIYFNTNTITEHGMRTSVDLWGKVRGGTSSACSFLIYSGLLYSILISRNVNKFIRIIILSLVIFVPLNAILISSRSALLYPIIIFTASYIATINRRNIVKRIIVLGIILLIVIVLYYNDFSGIRSYFESSFLYQRLEEKHDGGIVNNSRFGIWARRLDTIMDNFWGGGITLYGTNIYMHNIILDTIAYGGFPTAAILVLFMLHNISSVIYLFRRSKSYVEKSCLIGMLFAFMLIFMFEPIIQSSNWFFCLYLFSSGVIDQQKKNYKKMLKMQYGNNKTYPQINI